MSSAANAVSTKARRGYAFCPYCDAEIPCVKKRSHMNACLKNPENISSVESDANATVVIENSQPSNDSATQVDDNVVHVSAVESNQTIDPVSDQTIDPVSDQTIDPVSDQTIDPVSNEVDATPVADEVDATSAADEVDAILDQLDADPVSNEVDAILDQLDATPVSDEDSDADEDSASEAGDSTIIYCPNLKWSKAQKPLTISFNDIDTYDFKGNAFNEILDAPKYVHLYFDFDHIPVDQYDSVIDWLDTVKTVFGPYSVAGYTLNEDLAKRTGLRFHPQKGYADKDIKEISLHVVFYTTRILREALVDITKATEKKGFVNYKLHKLVDPAVYKPYQKFRHMLSDKYYGIRDPHNKENHGTILNDLKPSTQIVQVRGNEPIIKRDSWITVFPPIKPQPVADTAVKAATANINVAPKPKAAKTVSKMKINDVDFDADGLIALGEDALMDLLNHFPVNAETVLSDLRPILSSPYKKEVLKRVLTKWYRQKDHANNNRLDDIIERYYEHERSNKWFFSIIKHLNADDRASYIELMKTSVDMTVNINNSDWTLEDVQYKTFNINAMGQVLTKMRGIIGIVKDRWFLKQKVDGHAVITEHSQERIMKTLDKIKPIYKNNHINMYQLASLYSRLFIYKSFGVSKANEDEKINLFQGFKYQPIAPKDGDYSILDPLLKHTCVVVANNDPVKYDYFMKWFANIFQKVTVKNGTMMIIHGVQGSGKSLTCDLFAELLGNSANRNVDDLDKVFGKFNGMITDKMYINLNEPPEAGEKFAYAGKIKSKITEVKTIRETKGVDQMEIDSWANYTMTTNNANPIQEEKGNRRTIYFATNNEFVGNEEYFTALCKPFQPGGPKTPYVAEYMGILLHYMLHKVDVTGFNPEKLIREINNDTQTDYNENLERQYDSLNLVDRYVVEHASDFEGEGTTLDTIFIDGYKPNGIAKKLNAICDVVRRQVNKVQSRYYKLKPRNQIPDLYAIIDYYKYSRGEVEDVKTTKQDS